MRVSRFLTSSLVFLTSTVLRKYSLYTSELMGPRVFMKHVFLPPVFPCLTVKSAWHVIAVSTMSSLHKAENVGADEKTQSRVDAAIDCPRSPELDPPPTGRLK